MRKQNGQSMVAYLILVALVAISSMQAFTMLRQVVKTDLASEVARLGYIEFDIPQRDVPLPETQLPSELPSVVVPVVPSNDTTDISAEAAAHYSRNCENDQWIRYEGLFGRSNLVLDEIENAGTYGMKASTDIENQYHRYNKGNENNIKFTSKVANPETWYQENISNRYGRFEIVVRPNFNDNGEPLLNANGIPTFTHVTEPINMGTLNRGTNAIDHLIKDVRPYKKYGNTANNRPYTCA